MEEQRRQAMQESKFLGGDMEHTHLVKGLDYALLQKVRSDMTVQPMPAEMDTQAPVESSRQSAPAQAAAPAQPAAPSQQASLEFKTKLGKNIHKAVFQRALPAKNELFLPGRMCYAVQLDDEYTENDVPTTIIRSKADCPNVQSTVMTTNDIVIHKLTQVLSYLRGSRHDRKKMKRKDKGGEDRPMGKLPGASDPIFADLDSNYQSLPRDKDSAAKQAPSLPKFGNYFGSAQQQQQQQSEESKKEHMMGGLSKEQLAAGWAVADLARLQEPSTAAGAAPTAMARPEQPAAPGAAVGTAAAAAAPESAEAAQAASLKRTMQKEAISDSYMECYPGVGDDDGGYDSEEDADFSKMDRGAKKGPLKRWDFENEQEYAAYMDSREAMPKAAFQYGVKMNAGRKTRRFGKGGEKDEKAKIDREWKKISNMLDKRQGSGQRDGAPAAKRAR
ncbi:protein Red-like isoform X2 [Sycon ciliatum]|uniref:protein Red-like isoform X2 n=1 Tax=Sycon ciliatum TaxID=27933 RepID=UPI0031F6EDA5